MRCIADMDTVQIEITNACHLMCSNCTRFCGHHKKPYMMDLEYFKKAMDTMKGFPRMVGIMGGEPLLHPQFEEICEYAATIMPRDQLGLWTAFPDGKEKYRELIVRVFGNIFLNDHTRNDIYHAPILVGAEEIVANEQEMWYIVDHCWLQNSWSASINPKGAFFCEVAASMSVLFEHEKDENGKEDDRAWPLEDKWWLRIPAQYAEQMDKWCRRCGCALNLNRRSSNEIIDDISPLNLERLKGHSRKVDAGLYQLSDGKIVEQPQQMAKYKDNEYRSAMAERYGIYLTFNAQRFWVPNLMSNWTGYKPKKSLFDQFSGKYCQAHDTCDESSSKRKHPQQITREKLHQIHVN